MFKKALIGVGVLLVVILVGGFALPRTITVTRSQTISAAPEVVYALAATPREWPRWSAWNERDPKMQITYSGPETGAGAKWAWISPSQGNGSMVMTSAAAPSQVAFELTIEGMGPPSKGTFRIAPAGSGSTVTWEMTSEMMLGPIGGWMGLMFRPMLEKDFEAGLAKMKRVAEAPRT